jgi:hypothetical protein
LNFFTRWTNKGRVVYDRPKHIFSFKSIARILRDSIGEYEGNDPGNVVFVLYMALQTFASRASDATDQVLTVAEEALPEAFPAWWGIVRKFASVLTDLSREWMTRYGPISWESVKGRANLLSGMENAPAAVGAAIRAAAVAPDNPWDHAIEETYYLLEGYMLDTRPSLRGSKRG